ncbi:MAG: sulfotransferase domain-containing protein [Melioribacteraceae bacterium]|nr:sulfotransferase domain-containing protein [Melioribacteraceae bacterium]MCF8263078.1 sulfotransferase domain-containing protein [Melioribacteraceae bacterium]MCF8431226.1 sulfotransferase domain-containing protein [Melioribacteraceae bacterium]
MKKKIIICGYPKSGNTWLVRLTAEIIGCPVAGYWLAPQTNEQAEEGQNRISDSLCFKSHHSYNEFKQLSKYYLEGEEKLIYIVRDPRDIVVSGSHYFYFPAEKTRLNSISSKVPFGLRLYHKFVDQQQYRQDIMTNILLEGGQIILSKFDSWMSHVNGFINRDILFLKYEELIADPLKESRKICEYLGIDKEDESLITAIKNQSFEKKRKDFLDGNDHTRAKLLRSGNVGSWKKELSAKNLKRIELNVTETMKNLGYKDQMSHAG